MEVLGFAAALLMGVILGLMGGGGSILTVPILVYLFSMSPSMATGHSLFVVGITAMIGSFMYVRKNEIDYHAAISFAIPSVFGVYFSRAMVLPKIPTTIFEINGFTLNKDIFLMLTFSIIMILASTSMIKKKKFAGQSDNKIKNKIFRFAIQGFFVGIIAGFVGAGGGFLIIPALVFIAGLPMKIAVGTSLMIIAIQSLLGFFGDVFHGSQVHWSLLIMVATFAVIGIILGSMISHKLNDQKLKTTFGWFVLVMGVVILIEQIRHI